jgi:hypothetical protein
MFYRLRKKLRDAILKIAGLPVICFFYADEKFEHIFLLLWVFRSLYQSLLAQPLAEPEHAVPLSGGHPQGDLYHQRHRVAEQRHP